ncbi:MAG: response regulator [Myxococcales bacterium]|nr:response regulator [Myxococcales bacterium]
MPSLAPSAVAPISVLRILLAEDDDDHVLLTQRALRSLTCAVELEVVRDGADVFAVLDRGPSPNILLVDQHMPRMTGQAVIRTLRADPRYATLPIVLLSASMAGDEARRAEAGGASAFVPKSASLRRFSAALTRTIEALAGPLG